jgi:hypothetical protein
MTVKQVEIQRKEKRQGNNMKDNPESLDQNVVKKNIELFLNQYHTLIIIALEQTLISG